MRWQWAPLLAVAAAACTPLQPSGGRDPRPRDGDAKGEEPTALPPPGETPISTPPASSPPLVGGSDSTNDPVAQPPLAITVSVRQADGLFARSIVPTLATNCTTGGCHATPQLIDLRVFPFAAEGSYALDDIRADLGDEADPAEVQKRLVALLIDSMRTTYMPPPPASSIDESAVASFDAWLAANLATSEVPFAGRVVVTATNAADKVVCRTDDEVVAGTFRGIFDRASCQNFEQLSYEIIAADGRAVGNGSLARDEQAALTTWVIEVDL